VSRLKKFLPIILIVAVIGIGAYFYFGNKGTSLPGGSTTSDIFKGTLETAVQKGVPLKCEFKSDDNNYGTYWVKGESSYGEIISEGKTGYVIIKDNCMWSWTQGEAQGVKTCFEEFDYSSVEAPDYGDLDTPVATDVSEPEGDYSCSPAVISDSKFEAPSDINFMSF
jgi:hypothetical protein